MGSEFNLTWPSQEICFHHIFISPGIYYWHMRHSEHQLYEKVPEPAPPLLINLFSFGLVSYSGVIHAGCFHLLLVCSLHPPDTLPELRKPVKITTYFPAPHTIAPFNSPLLGCWEAPQNEPVSPTWNALTFKRLPFAVSFPSQFSPVQSFSLLGEFQHWHPLGQSIIFSWDFSSHLLTVSL